MYPAHLQLIQAFQELIHSSGSSQTWLHVTSPSNAKPGQKLDVYLLPEGKSKPYHMTPQVCLHISKDAYVLPLCIMHPPHFLSLPLKLLVNQEGKEYRWAGKLLLEGLFRGAN